MKNQTLSLLAVVSACLLALFGCSPSSDSGGSGDNSTDVLVPAASTVTTVTLRAYELDDNATSSSTPITNAEKQAGTFTEINDSTISSRGWTMTDTGATYSVEVGKSCYSWSRTTSVSHVVNGVSYSAGHYHYNAADNTSYTNGVYNWTEYGPEHSQSEIDTTCAAGTGGVVKTANSDNYTADVTIYLKIDSVTTQ